MFRSNILFLVLSFVMTSIVQAQMVPFAFTRKKPPPLPAPPSLIASSSATTGNTGTKTVVTKPGGVLVGDLMVVWQAKANASIVTAPAGWTKWQSISISGYGHNLFSKVADAADVAAADFTFTWPTSASTSDRHAIILHYRGVNATIPVTGTTGNTGSSSTATYLGATTTSANSILLVLCSSYSFPSAPTGFTSRNADGWATRISDKVQRNIGATGNFTSTADTAWGSMLMVISP